MIVPGGFPQRGEVYWTDFSTARGGEVGKRRPAVVVSNDISNRFANRVQLVPLTSNTQRLYPGEASVLVAGRVGKAMADQLTTATKERLGDYIATLSTADLRKVERAIAVQLDLPMAIVDDT